MVKVFFIVFFFFCEVCDVIIEVLVEYFNCFFDCYFFFQLGVGKEGFGNVFFVVFVCFGGYDVFEFCYFKCDGEGCVWNLFFCGFIEVFI